MIRGDSALVRRLGRQARRAWKKLPRARRRSAGSRPGLFSRQHSFAKLRAGVSLLIFVLVAAPEPSIGLLFSLLALHTLLATLRQTANLVAELHEPTRLLMPFLLPLDDQKIFDAQTGPFHTALRALALDWLMFGLGLAFWRGQAGWWIAAPLLALAQAGFSGCAALFLARLRPDRRWAMINVALSLLLGALVVFGRHSSLLTSAGSAGLRIVGRFTPAGLLANLAHHAATQNPLAFFAPGLTATAMIGLAWRLERRWRAAYSTRFLDDADHGNEPAGDQNPEAADDDTSIAENTYTGSDAMPARQAADPVGRAGGHGYPGDPAPSRESLRRELRARLDYDPGEAYASQGPVEDAISRLWSARQRHLLALYSPPPSRWHRRVRLAALLAGLAGVAALVTGRMPVALIGAGVGYALLLPVWESRWGALWLLVNGPARSALHGYLPIPLFSLAGAYLSQTYAKALLAGALLTLALAPWIGIAHALRFGALGCCLGMIWCPLAFIFSLSAGTNDTSSSWWFSLLIILFGGATMIGGLILFMIAAAYEDSRVLAVCAGLGVVGANALLGAYLWAAGRSCFDLMPRPR